MIPEEVEIRLAGQPDSATVAAVLATLRADPAWTVTEVTVDGRPVLVELAYEPTGLVYTLRTQLRQRANAPDHDP